MSARRAPLPADYRSTDDCRTASIPDRDDKQQQRWSPQVLLPHARVSCAAERDPTLLCVTDVNCNKAGARRPSGPFFTGALVSCSETDSWVASGLGLVQYVVLPHLTFCKRSVGSTLTDNRAQRSLQLWTQLSRLREVCYHHSATQLGRLASHRAGMRVNMW